MVLPPSDDPPPWQPIEGERVWPSPVPLWLKNRTTDRALLTRVDTTHCALVGTLPADDEVAAAVRDAVRRRHYDALTVFPGSYYVVVAEPDATHVYGDVAGVLPVYYTAHRSAVLYCSLARPLADLTAAPVDPQWIAVRAMCPGMPELTQSRSPFTGVAAVPPGHVLRVRRTGSGVTASCEIYWRPPAATEQLADVAPLFGRVLREAIRVRVSAGHRLSSDMSGGMDSTTLAVLAARESAARGTQVLGLTYGDPDDPANEDLPFAREAAATPGLVHDIVDTKKLPAYFTPAEVPYLDGPAQIVGATARLRALFGRCPGGVHLTGHGGDAIVGAGEGINVDLLRGRRAGLFLRYVRSQARTQHRSAIAVAGDAARATVTPYRRTLQRYAREVSRSAAPVDHLTVHRFAAWGAPPLPISWLTAQARDLVADRLRGHARDGDGFAPSPAQHGSISEVRAIAAVCTVLSRIADGDGLRLAFPYIDRRMIDAALACRPEQREPLHGLKPLLVTAARGVLPTSPGFLDRTSKFVSGYAADYHVSVARNWREVRTLLDDSRLAALGLIEPTPLLATLNLFRAGAAPEWLASLYWTLGCELWLRDLDRSPAPFWSTR